MYYFRYHITRYVEVLVNIEYTEHTLVIQLKLRVIEIGQRIDSVVRNLCNRNSHKFMIKTILQHRSKLVICNEYFLYFGLNEFYRKSAL